MSDFTILYLDSEPGHDVPEGHERVRPGRVLLGQERGVPGEHVPAGRHDLQGRPGLLLQVTEHIFFLYRSFRSEWN